MAYNPYLLTNQLSVTPINCNVGYNNSWISVENNANRPMFAQASYVTNFDDLNISLSAGNVTIGAVEIKDGNSNLRADVTTSDGLNALRVLTQDLESSVDDITIGDKQGNFVTIQMPQSALRVYPVTTAGGFTRCETRTSGNPTFISDQIFIHNSSNSNVQPILTLTQGTSCRLAIGKSTETNHTLTLNLAVSGFNDYAGCEITFFA
jgi:hypothetical protein